MRQSRIPALIGALAVSAMTAACGTGQAATDSSAAGPFAAPDLPALAGQSATCAGPREKRFTLEAREVTVDLGMNIKFNAWTYNGKLPGPVLEACEGDRVTITVVNHASTSHGLDSHALRTDTMHFGPVAPDGSMTLEQTVDARGAFMSHCGSGPVTDSHIKSGLNGAMIVYPRRQPLGPARELVVVESGVYGTPDANGIIPGTDPSRAQKNDPGLM